MIYRQMTLKGWPTKNSGTMHVCERTSFQGIRTQESSYQDHYLECELSCGNCLIPLKAIVEVLPSSQQYTHLPLTPSWMPGLFAWRGETIALIDLDMYLCRVSSSRQGGMFVIANYNDITVGLLSSSNWADYHHSIRASESYHRASCILYANSSRCDYRGLC